MARFHAQILAVFIALSGCASTDALSDRMAGWQDADIDVAIDAWGEPDDSRPFADGKILVWRDRATAPVLHSGEPAALPVVCERMLAVAPDGTITGWRWRGDACPSLPENRSKARLVAGRETF